MAYQLLTKYSSDSAVKAIVDKFDFYITPVVNPDGKTSSANLADLF
jgi:murein tripeptide amidase MpaA